MSTLERTASRVRVVVSALVVAVLAVGGWTAWRRLVRERWAGPLREHEARAASAVDTFCAAEAELARVPVFAPHGSARDAAPFLNLLVGFGDTGVDGGVPVPRGTLGISLAVKNALKAAPDFMDAAADPAIAALDTSALAAAHDYDHWDLTGPGSPLTGAATWNGANAPLPKFIDLLAAAKVHLATAGRAGTLKDAARDVRQLARLCASTESLIGAMVAVAMLNVERRAYDWAVAHAVDTGDWKPVDEAVTSHARAVLQLSPTFLGPMVDEATFARALACAEVSRCVGLTEAVLLGGGLAPSLPEPAQSRMRTALGVVSAPGKSCRFAVARYFAPRSMVPELVDVPGWLPGDDIGGLILATAIPGLAPLDVLLDAGIAPVDAGVR